MCFFTFIEVSCEGRSEEESDLFDLYAFSLYTDLKRRFFNFSYYAKILSADQMNLSESLINFVMILYFQYIL